LVLFKQLADGVYSGERQIVVVGDILVNIDLFRPIFAQSWSDLRGRGTQYDGFGTAQLAAFPSTSREERAALPSSISMRTQIVLDMNLFS